MTGAMGGEVSEEAGGRLQQLYWRQFVELKVACEYIRRYQAVFRWWVRRIAVLRAGASVGAIGTWAVVQSHPLVWGGIIAAAQVADAMQGAIPFNRNYQAASALVLALDALFITAQGEWEDIYAGRIDEAALAKARLRLMQQMHEVQAKHFPDGLHRRDDLLRLAERDATTYFETTFGRTADDEQTNH